MVTLMGDAYHRLAARLRLVSSDVPGFLFPLRESSHQTICVAYTHPQGKVAQQAPRCYDLEERTPMHRLCRRCRTELNPQLGVCGNEANTLMGAVGSSRSSGTSWNSIASTSGGWREQASTATSRLERIGCYQRYQATLRTS